MKKKIAFATCVQLGLSCIEEIYRIGGSLDLLITLKDEKAKNKSGRIYLDEIATEHNAPILKIDNINDQEVLSVLKEHQIDWLFIIGWSQIARKDVLETPTYGCIGMHPTLLPVGRGRAAIPWAIIKGLDETGVTMFKLDEGVDTGDIIGQGVIKLDQDTTATELYQKVDDMHITLIAKYWNDIVNNNITLTKQNDADATEWPGRKPEDGEILSGMTMDEAGKLVRAVTHPYPGAFYKDGDKTIRVWSAKTDKNDGGIKLSDGYLIPIDYEIEGL
ncbi:methionyl-tRNA formyltransferase [Alkalihalobacillus alcalophilus ATCC 27647 = CGMCC 1.3604]|uniref:Methionyl-tRNA formyltransferase n=1 Tax=Alkalihalobacillus alcalophilus ATCC 27647 = CGMCC 1.3604 TaxID=1218173 RepID=A0A094XBX9_ALKAL|nr:formyltransferase family protein [Alkalihalobacillus alcalophilus]KGA96280.1 methionyl-tRNA formyltransferase [Alkalihalobacillus alcalophilus ATCC 27647 = CGMCC 1.3604]MED1563382.1 formyltransferase family protein [Alkalihalobacillus alcalophilus]THG91651.1 methionyl-tRNA formyltransferase [Alkalihalobacillus alcalophilus ATCC 27647 = CGMCC 1.3604]